MTSLAISPSTSRPRWLLPLLVVVLVGSALASWLLIRDGQQAAVPAVVEAPETAALQLSVGNDPAALRVPKPQRATTSSAVASAAAPSSASASSAAAPSSGSAPAPVASAPSSSSSSSGTEPAALEFGR